MQASQESTQASKLSRELQQWFVALVAQERAAESLPATQVEEGQHLLEQRSREGGQGRAVGPSSLPGRAGAGRVLARSVGLAARGRVVELALHKNTAGVPAHGAWMEFRFGLEL